MTDIAHEFFGQVLDGGEDAARDHIAFDFGEPELHLIQPRRVRRCEMQMHLRIDLQELSDSPSLVRREVIRDDMDLLPPGLSDDEVHQKCDELLGGMALGRLPEHGARLGIEGGVQGQGAMPIVFEAMPLCPTRRQGAAPDLCDPGPGWPSSHRRKTPPHAAGGGR